MKISEIKLLLNEDSVSKQIIKELENDDRSGVKKLLQNYKNKQEKKFFLKKEYEKRTEFENKCYNKGYNYICGIDEVGRGPLAGPVVAAAVILKKDSYFEGLNDSKKLSKVKREKLCEQIKKEAISYSIIEIDNIEIEKYNIYRATQIAMLRAIEGLTVNPDFLLIDAMPLDVTIPNVSIVKGDEKSISIAAASIIAKVYRDNLMVEYSKKYPHYDFENNAGYGTPKHLAGIEKYGICSIHRRDFEPIKSIIKKGGRNG